MATTTKVLYQSPATDLTCTLASLATSSTKVAGRETSEIDNTTNLYDDYRICGFVDTGTTPTVNTAIEIWLISKLNMATPAYPDTFGGTDAGVTVTSRNVLNALCPRGPLWQAIVTTATAIKYPIDRSVLEYFGGLWVPPKFSLWVVHNTGVNLNSTGGNHVLSYTGLYLQGV